MPRPRVGLRVKWCENVASYHDPRANHGLHCLKAAVPDGWRIMVRYGGKWHPWMDLQFAREKDALRAAQAMTAAKFDTIAALRSADPSTVKQVACEWLGW